MRDAHVERGARGTTGTGRARRPGRTPPRTRLVRTLLAAAVVALATACGGPDPVGTRVVVLGFDGMDHELTRRMMEEGRLPNLERMAEQGAFSPLETSVPPQSPVAWSDFITGLDAGGHGIFDFLHRDPGTMVPYLSTTVTEPPGRALTLGPYQIPLGGGEIVLMRRGVPFWEVLEERGVPTTIVRMPANFPPSGTATRELSGMGTPDILGGYGTYSFFTTAPERMGGSPGGDVQRAEIRRGVLEASLRGPPNPLLAEPEELRAGFTVYLDPVRPVVKIEIGGEELVLQEGDWSGWVPVEYSLPLMQTLGGMVRFYLKQVRPEFQLYASPVNIDPLEPAMPISTPEDFAAELASDGRFYTQGFPEDTDAISDGVFDHDEFLAQAALASDEIRDQYLELLAEYDDGLLFNYFGYIDQVSHIMWRAMDPGHPAYDEERDGPYAHVIEDLYVEADSTVGTTLERLEEIGGGTLVVMSDHGFTSWRRSFSLNAWLEENGYLTVRDPNRRDLDFLANVDWAETRAYALGLSGLYLNLEGREADGIVPPAERGALLEEITRKLLSEVDPATGEPAITRVYPRDEAYTDRGHAGIGPDLVVGYAEGVRSSDASAAGRIPADVWADNMNAWSGDHIMDHEVVPGVLVTNRPLEERPASLQDLAAAVLAEFGVEDFPAVAGTEPGESRLSRTEP